MPKSQPCVQVTCEKYEQNMSFLHIKAIIKMAEAYSAHYKWKKHTLWINGTD